MESTALAVCDEWADREMGEDEAELKGEASGRVKFIKKKKREAAAADKTCHLLSWEAESSHVKMLFHFRV